MSLEGTITTTTTTTTLRHWTSRNGEEAWDFTGRKAVWKRRRDDKSCLLGIIGLKEVQLQIFQGMSWTPCFITNCVLKQTFIEEIHVVHCQLLTHVPSLANKATRNDIFWIINTITKKCLRLCFGLNNTFFPKQDSFLTPVPTGTY